MKNTFMTVLMLGLMAGSVHAQEQVLEEQQNEEQETKVENPDIIKTEIKLGHQILTNHGQHLFGTATGEANLPGNEAGHIQLLPFEVNIYSHYNGLSHIQIQNMKATAINFMMDSKHFGIGAGMVTKENFGYRETQVGVKTISPIVVHAFHTVELQDGQTVLKVSGYLSYGKAYGFGDNARYAFDVDGTQFNGSVVPAGVNSEINFNDKVQVKGFVDYQHLQSSDDSGTIALNEVKYGMTINLNLSEVLNQKLRGINLYATVSNQSMMYSYKGLNMPKTDLSKQNYLNVQAGVAINLNVKAKKKPVPLFE